MRGDIRLNPRKTTDCFERADLYQANRPYGAAIDTLLVVVRGESTSEEHRRALFELAELYLELGDLEQALVYWNKAVASSGGEIDASAYELHGTILLNQYRSASIDTRDAGLLDRAAQSFERAVQLDPERDTLAVIYLGLGRTFHDRGLMDRAVAYLEKAIALAENGQLIADLSFNPGPARSTPAG